MDKDIEKSYDDIDHLEHSSSYDQITNENITLKELFAFLISDIDIFLLKEDNQIDDKIKLFSNEEIRIQLGESLTKFSDIFSKYLNLPIHKSFLLYSVLKPHTNTLSKTEKEDFINHIYNS